MRCTLLLVAALSLAVSANVGARQDAPVFADDSVAAAEVLGTRDQPRGLAGALIDARNLSEAARVLQGLLDADAERVVASPEDPNLFLSVRRRVHEVLLSSPTLLEKYRVEESARAAALLDAGDASGVERSRLLTAPGLEACLRLAQRQFEAARFDGAWLMLIQLEEHPDRQAAGAQDAARLALDLARYLARADATERARRWATEALLPASEVDSRAGELAAPEGASRRSGLRLPALPEPVDLPEAPLRSVALPWKSEIADDEPPLRAATDEPEQSWVIPSIVGDWVYVNDGVAISALDRYTLRRRWVTRPSDQGIEAMAARRDEQSPSVHRGIGRVLEDPTTTTVAGNVVVATTGHALQQRRDGDPRVHALDATTGRLLWSTDVQFLDAQLAGAIVRGPAIIDSDTVILGVRKFATTRRLVTSYVVGLDIADGSARWIRLVGSAGSLPIRRGNLTTDAPTLQRGVVYRADELGLVAALESGTGRPIWVRRLGGVRSFLGMSQTPAWSFSAPVVVGDSVFVLTPLSAGVLRLDASTGQLLDRRSADDLGAPNFLVLAGDHLAAVGADQISFVRHTEFADGQVRLSPSYNLSVMRGRPVFAGARLIVPTGDGLSIVDPAEPTHESLVDLRTTGNVLPGDPGEGRAHLLVADADSLHTHLSWDTAERLLQRRIERDPADPTPAMTLADLAFAAGRFDRIAPAVDLALGVISRDPESTVSAAARRTLFSSIGRMVDPDAPEAHAIDIPPDQRLRLLNQMERLAESPTERVQHLLCRARFFERSPAAASEQGGPLAVDAYQRVLLESDLAGLPWVGGLAADAATARVRDLVMRLGPGIYRVFDEEARRELATLGPGAADVELEALARRYPCASATPGLWTRLADQAAARGDAGAASAALGQALLAAEVLAGAGPAEAQRELADAASRLVSALLRAERPGAALRLVGRVAHQHPRLALSVDGTPTDATRLAEELVARCRASVRRPRIGALTGRVEPLMGWSILDPSSRKSAGVPTDLVAMFNAAESRTALFALSPEDNRLEEVWSKPGNPSLLRLDADGAYFFWSEARSGRIERVDPGARGHAWTSANIGEALGPGPPTRADEQLATPLDGPVDGRDLLLAADADHLVLVERRGRTCALDTRTGAVLWSSMLPLKIAFDATVSGAVLTVCGATEISPERGPEGHVILRIDAATGRALGAPIEPSSGTRWVRIASDRTLIGLEGGIMALDGEGRPAWALDDQSIQKSADAWVVGPSVFILTRSRDLMTLDWRTGMNLAGPADNRGKLAGGGLMRAYELPGHSAFCTRQGLLIYDAAGTLVGADALSSTTDMLYPDPASDKFIVVGSELESTSDGRQAFTIHFVEAPTGRLISSRSIVAHEVPSQMALLDGRILVTVGHITLIVDAPAGP